MIFPFRIVLKTYVKHKYAKFLKSCNMIIILGKVFPSSIIDKKTKKKHSKEDNPKNVPS